jgi:O-antigen ligase
MNEFVLDRAHASGTPTLALVGRRGALLLAIGLLALGVADLFNSTSVSVALALAGGLALTGFLVLTISRFEVAVAIGLLLMGLVRFEPAPTDLAFAVIMTVAAVTGRFRLERVPLLLRWIVGLLLVINVLSMVDDVVTSAALRFVFVTAYLAIFSLWLAGYVDSPRRARLVVVTWLGVAVVSAVVSVAALNLPVPGRAFILGTVDGGERASGLFKDPNVFGPFLVPIAVILLEQRIAPRVPRVLRMRRLSSWMCLLALTLGILFSYSRAAWGNFAIALVVMLVASSLRRAGAQRALRAIVVLLATGATAAMLLSATGSVSFLQHRAHLQSYDSQRFAAQDFGWKLGWTHPLGVGPGQFHFHYPVETHSTFIRVFSEQGFLGLLLWIALLLVTLVLALRNVVVGRDTYGIGSAALLGAWCGLIFNSVVVDTLHWRHLWVVAALIWAGAVRRNIGPKALPRDGPERTQHRVRRPSRVLAIQRSSMPARASAQSR